MRWRPSAHARVLAELASLGCALVAYVKLTMAFSRRIVLTQGLRGAETHS
jgi:hypothetical protein